jgi:hypothetical protein
MTMSRIQPSYAFLAEVDRDADDEATTLEVAGTVTAYDPGRTCGPPESCYPPEGGEVEIESVTLLVDGQPSRELSADDLTGREIRAVERQALLASPGD